MCGINGIFHFEKSSQVEGEIQKMNDAIAFRGPDASGVYSDHKIQLGHRRLSIIDTSESANQPMFSADENYVIVFNGELYNYREIKKQLADYAFKTNSDTEVVLASWMKWGEHALRIFNGIFAFAIWSKKDHELILVRDRLGVKPLYYFTNNDVFQFSSGIKAILATDRSSRKISSEALADYLRYQTVHAPNTLIEDIFVLMPGTIMRVNDEHGITEKKYWQITQTNTPKISSYDEAKSVVRNQLYKSVEMQLVSDVPFGAFLSGGIDSSILVAIMSQVRSQKIDTFSVVFKEDQFSEKKYADLISKKYQTNHHEIHLSANDFLEMIPDALSFTDHPSGDGPNSYVVSKKTHEQGIKMAISGLGGDELFGGYSVFKQLPELYSKKWLRSFPNYLRSPASRIYKSVKGDIPSSKIAELMSLENFDVEDIYKIYRQVFLDDQVAKLMNAKTLPQNKTFEIVQQLVGYKKQGWSLPMLSKISIAEMSTYMQNVLLRDTDQMSMANGLEVRVPFLDHELVELVLGISDEFKKPTTPKKLLTDTFSDLIPQEIYNRPKMGFVLPFDVWMKNELKNFCHEQLEFLGSTHHFNASYVNQLWSDYLKGKKNISWSRIWILVVLANWMKTNNVN